MIIMKVNFLDKTQLKENKIEYVVITAFYKGQIVVVKHRDRTTWEIPGGHKENFESCRSYLR